MLQTDELFGFQSHNVSGCRGNIGARGTEGISGGKGFVLCLPWSNWLCAGVHSDSDKGGLVCSV